MGTFQIFSEQQIESLRRGGSILRETLNLMESIACAGMTTKDLDQKAEEHITSFEGATPGFKGYRGFPGTLCTSVNEACVHGIPDDTVLSDGDIVSVDCGVIVDGLYTDACVTIPIGQVSSETQQLLDVTKNALYAGLDALKGGAMTGDVSHAVQELVESEGLTIVKPLTGHGLGTELHQFPDVPNFGKPGSGYEVPLNTILAIEPIVATGKGDITQSSDGWTISMKDGGYSAHFEHTVLITQDGYEILA